CPDAKVRDPGEAVQLAKRAVELAPWEAGYWGTLGLASYEAGEWQAAIDALTRSMELRKGGELDPKLASAWTIRGDAYLKLGQADKAVADFSRAIDLDPKDAAARYTRGTASLNLGKLEKAVADLSRAVALQPDIPEAHCNLGHALLGQGR